MWERYDQVGVWVEGKEELSCSRVPKCEARGAPSICGGSG